MGDAYQAASFGGWPTEGGYTDRRSQERLSFGAEKVPASPRKRLIIALCVFGALGAAIGLGSSLDWETIYRGEGYVPWRLTQPHAVADCRQYGKHLVLYTVDPAHPANDRLRKHVLADDEVQHLSAGLVWYRNELQGEELHAARQETEDPSAPLPPTVEIVAWNLEGVLAEPRDASTITVGEFVGMMKEALAIDANPNEVR